MKKPLIYSTARAAKEAERLLPGCVLELEVEKAIVSNQIVGGSRGGVVFDPERRWVARIKREQGRLRARPRAWVVVSIEPHRKTLTPQKEAMNHDTD